MTSASRIVVLAVGVALARATSAADDPPEIHECRGATGEVVYQSDPCEDPVARPGRPRVPGGPAAATAAPIAPGTLGAGVSSARTPSFPAKDPSPGGAPASRAPASVPLGGADRRPGSIRVVAASADPRWSSPERTWQTFVAAMNDGDRPRVLECLTSSARSGFGEEIASLPPEKLRATVAVYTRLVIAGDAGPFRTARASRTTGGAKWVFFEQTPAGDWKIAAF